MSDEEKKQLTEHDRAIVRATVEEFMRQVYQGVGKGVIERLFWLAVGALLFAYFGGHFPSK